jgi:hypothetical protein
VHRVDAQLAGGVVAPVPVELALDGIDEYFLMANVRVLPQRPGFALGGTVHLHATDGDGSGSGSGEWMLADHDGRIAVTAEHGKGDAAVRGTASDLLLGLWGRLDLRADDRFERFGSPAPLDALAGVGGN